MKQKKYVSYLKVCTQATVLKMSKFWKWTLQLAFITQMQFWSYMGLVIVIFAPIHGQRKGPPNIPPKLK